jgi:hypothetical protein
MMVGCHGQLMLVALDPQTGASGSGQLGQLVCELSKATTNIEYLVPGLYRHQCDTPGIDQFIEL